MPPARLIPEDFPENAEVEVFLQQGPAMIPASVKDPEERARIRRKVVERRQKTRSPPTPGDSPASSSMNAVDTNVLVEDLDTHNGLDGIEIANPFANR